MTDEQVIGGNDPAGLETLELFADTVQFNKWLFESLAPYCKSHVLEIGSGIGNISALLENKFDKVTLSDLRPEYCEFLEKKFASSQHVKGVRLIDLSVKDIRASYPDLIGAFDSIVASNVVEHIEDDRLVMRNCASMLKPGGHAVVLVPAYQWLYNSFDKELGHYRRYTKKSLKRVFEEEGFKVIHSQYFNAAGMAGWWLFGSVFKKKILPKGKISLYNKLVPLFRVLDKMLMKRMGLSVIVIGQKL
jgi:2-polyprenyl-3-methyl-5-hydroxy-6-metoxy-1,4-benzoquinol methylase